MQKGPDYPYGILGKLNAKRLRDPCPNNVKTFLRDMHFWAEES